MAQRQLAGQVEPGMRVAIGQRQHEELRRALGGKGDAFGD